MTNGRCSRQKKHDKKFVLALVKEEGKVLQHAEKKKKNDKDIVLAAVENDPLALQFASEDRKADMDVIHVALKEREETYPYDEPDYERAFQFISSKLRDDRKFATWALDTTPHWLQYLPAFHNDKDMVRTSCSRYAKCLRWASTALKQDREFITELLDINSLCLSEAEFVFRDDKNLILPIIQSYGHLYQYLSLRLQQDREIVDIVAKQSHFYLPWIYSNNPELAADTSFNLPIVTQCCEALEYVSNEMKDNKEIVRAAISQDWKCFKFSSTRLKKHAELVILAASQNQKALYYVPQEQKRNSSFARELILGLQTNQLASFPPSVLSQARYSPNKSAYK